jgi:hypothetical protein
VCQPDGEAIVCGAKLLVQGVTVALPPNATCVARRWFRLWDGRRLCNMSTLSWVLIAGGVVLLIILLVVRSQKARGG